MRSREEVLREFTTKPCPLTRNGTVRMMVDIDAMADRIRELEAEVSRYIDTFQSAEGVTPRGETVAWEDHDTLFLLSTMANSTRGDDEQVTAEWKLSFGMIRRLVADLEKLAATPDALGVEHG